LAAAEIRLITEDSVANVAGVIFATSKEFGQELGNIVNLHFLSLGKMTWFSELRSRRKKEGKGDYKDPLDIRFLLFESSSPDSPLPTAIPGFSDGWKHEADLLRRKLNSWMHYSLEPDLDTLEDILTVMSTLAQMSGLSLLQEIAKQMHRIHEIRNGWKPEVPGQQEPQSPEVEAFVSEVKVKKDRIFARPPVGSVWNGPIGSRVIELNKNLRDALEDGVSVAHEMGANGKDKVREWLRYFPQGGDIRVSDDGAVMGYIKGVPILIGWFGEEPDVNPDDIRGYYLPHDYEFTGSDVKDLQTGSLLTESTQDDVQDLIKLLAAKLDVGSVINVTTYGDVVFESSDLDEVQKLTRIHKDVWFIGQII
jgi:hypothetical protein